MITWVQSSSSCLIPTIAPGVHYHFLRSRWGKWGSERLSDLPKITERTRVRATTQAHGCQLPDFENTSSVSKPWFQENWICFALQSPTSYSPWESLRNFQSLGIHTQKKGENVAGSAYLFNTQRRKCIVKHEKLLLLFLLSSLEENSQIAKHQRSDISSYNTDGVHGEFFKLQHRIAIKLLIIMGNDAGFQYFKYTRTLLWMV